MCRPNRQMRTSAGHGLFHRTTPLRFQCVRLSCWKIRLKSSINRSRAGSVRTTRGRTATCPDTARLCRLSRTASRNRRLSRFRATAVRTDFETKMPYLNCSAGCQIRVKKSVGNRCPLPKRESISTRRFNDAERGSLLFPTNLWRQQFAALSAPASQHFAAVPGRHTRAEAVIVQSFAIRWLKCSFHNFCLLLKELWNISITYRPSRD